MNMLDMEKSREHRPGYAREGTIAIPISLACAGGMDSLALLRANGVGVGHLRGYARNGGDLISSVCTGAAGHSVLEDPSAGREGAFSGAAMGSMAWWSSYRNAPFMGMK